MKFDLLVYRFAIAKHCFSSLNLFYKEFEFHCQTWIRRQIFCDGTQDWKFETLWLYGDEIRASCRLFWNCAWRTYNTCWNSVDHLKKESLFFLLRIFPVDWDSPTSRFYNVLFYYIKMFLFIKLARQAHTYGNRILTFKRGFESQFPA